MAISSLNQFVGEDVGGYRVERLLGHGRVNAVYQAYHATQNTPVALMTFILPETFSLEARQRFLQRFRKEAARLTALRQPHILSVHDYGEYAGYPYLITPYMTNGSLADMLKRRGRLLHTDVLDILQQVGAGLAYAHSRGVFHQALKPSNIVLNNQQQMLVAGFGLTQILQMRGIERDERAYGHLFSIAGTFLTSAEYIAPEVVQGQSGDARTDIYSLGVILFEMLTGKTPFTGTNPLEVARQHVQQPVLSLRTHNPDIPLALAAVVNQALDRNPARRFQQVDELVEAFAQVSTALPGKGTSATVRSGRDVEVEEMPDVEYALGSWQLLPPIVTGKIAAVGPTSQKTNSQDLNWLALPANASPTLVPSSEQSVALPFLPAREQEPIVTARSPQEAIYDLWAASPQEPLTLRRSGATQANVNSLERRLASTQHSLPFLQGRKTRRNERVSRRRVVALLVAGGVALAGTVVAINLSGNTPNQQAQNPPVSASNQQTQNNTPNLAKNAAMNFNGNASVLVHLADGNFVAYSRHCTHVGVLVDYDPALQLLVCPAHGATFDPAQNGAVRQGPATRPLPQVTFHVNADGTITA